MLKKKILFFVRNFDGGGKERRCLELLKQLDQNPSLDITILMLNDNVVYPDFHTLSFKKYSLKSKDQLNFITLWHFYKFVGEIRPDIIHTWSITTSFYTVIMKLFFCFKLINSQIGDAPDRVNWFSKSGILNRINFSFSDIVLSNTHKGLVSYKIPSIKGFVTYNGFDVKRLELIQPNSLNDTYNFSNKFVVGMIAAFSKRKDYDTFLKVADLLSGKSKEFLFVCAGNGELLEEYKSLYSHKLSIIFPGHLENIDSLIPLCHVGVLMTNGTFHGEGIPNSILEFMAFGKPVIVSNSGGVGELVEDEVNGFIIPDKSVSELANKILYLKENRDICHKWGETNQRKIIEQFSSQKMVKNYLNLYIGTEQRI